MISGKGWLGRNETANEASFFWELVEAAQRQAFANRRGLSQGNQLLLGAGGGGSTWYAGHLRKAERHEESLAGGLACEARPLLEAGGGGSTLGCCISGGAATIGGGSIDCGGGAAIAAMGTSWYLCAPELIWLATLAGTAT